MKNFQISLSALTIGEFVIGLAIIGVLALILIPIYKTATPNKLDSLHKKATYTVDRIVNELSTDEYLYPNNGEYTGLSNTTSITYNGELHGGSTKFCSLFASRIIRKPDTEVRCFPNAVSVTSQEGMDWYLPISDFKTGSETILVDVNGSDLPNELGTDRFEYKVKPGLKVEVEEPTFYAPTGAPPSKGTGGGAPSGPDKDNRTAQNVYGIYCDGSGATIYGQGPNKVNGTYTLVAVPNKGYKCNWFIHQVTVKDSDVTDCNLSCSPDNNIPASDGETIIPDPVPDEPDKPDDSYCINVTVTGESDQCSVSGAGCGKKNGSYVVSVSSKDSSKYAPDWSSKKVTIFNGDANETVSCNLLDQTKCYGITVKGSAEEKANCPVTLPSGNCPDGNEGGPYKSGTHTVVVTPKEGYMFNNSTEASDVKVEIVDKDGVVDLTGKCLSAAQAKKLIVYLNGGQNRWAEWGGDWSLKLNSSDLGYGTRILGELHSNVETIEYPNAKAKKDDTVTAELSHIEYTLANGYAQKCGGKITASGKVTENSYGNLIANVNFDCDSIVETPKPAKVTVWFTVYNVAYSDAEGTITLTPTDGSGKKRTIDLSGYSSSDTKKIVEVPAGSYNVTTSSSAKIKLNKGGEWVDVNNLKVYPTKITLASGGTGEISVEADYKTYRMDVRIGYLLDVNCLPSSAVDLVCQISLNGEGGPISNTFKISNLSANTIGGEQLVGSWTMNAGIYSLSGISCSFGNTPASISNIYFSNNQVNIGSALNMNFNENFKFYANAQCADGDYILSINYVDESGKSMIGRLDSSSASVQYRYPAGYKYSITAPTASGYTVDKSVISGTMPAHDVEITFVYKKSNEDDYRDWAIIRSDLIETAEGSQAVWVEYYVSGVVVNSFKRSLIVYGTGDNGCKSQYTLNPGTVPPGTYDGSSYRFRNTAHFSCYCNSFSYELK